MTLKLQLQLVVKERKVAIIMRIPNPDMNIMLRAIVRNTVNVCGRRVTLIFFKIVWMCPLTAYSTTVDS